MGPLYYKRDVPRTSPNATVVEKVIFDLEIANRVFPPASYLARGPTVGCTSVFHQLFS